MSTWLRLATLTVALSLGACQTAPATDVSVPSPAAAAASPAEQRVDHFKIWKVEPRPYQRTVGLQGQFDEGPWPARVQAAEYVANPVEKTVAETVTPIRFADRHLVGYVIAPPDPPQPERWVTFRNQLGDARWAIDQPSLLFLPASKVHDGSAPPPPPGLDHYLCYETRSDEAVDRPLRLVDQFDRRRDVVEHVERLLPAYFCVPVPKPGRPLVHPDVHLAIYTIDARTTLTPPIEVETRDQFRRHRLRATESVMLAVPSIKTGWGEVGEG